MGNEPRRKRRRSIRLEGYDYSQPGAYFVTICTQHGECLFGQVIDGRMRLNDAGRMVKSVWDELPDHYPGVRIDAFVVMPNHVHGIVVLTGGSMMDDPVGATPCGCPNDGLTVDDQDGQARGPAPTAKWRGDDPVGATPCGCPNDGLTVDDQDGQARGPAPTAKWRGDDPVGAAPCGCPNGGLTSDDQDGQARGPAPTVGWQGDGRTGRMSLPDVVHRFKSFTTAKYRHGVKRAGWSPFPGRLWQRNYWEHVIRNERALRQIQEYIVNNPARWAEDRLHPDVPSNPFAGRPR